MTTRLASDVHQIHLLHRQRANGVEGLCALAGIVLAFIGLAGGARLFDAIASIVIGAAFLFETWTVITAPRELEHRRGIWADRAAGGLGVVLGILALLRVGPTVLAPISLLVFGAGLVFGMGFASRTTRVVIGLAAIVLSILAIIQLDPRTLTLTGIIAVGTALLVTGPAAGWRAARRDRNRRRKSSGNSGIQVLNGR